MHLSIQTSEYEDERIADILHDLRTALSLTQYLEKLNNQEEFFTPKNVTVTDYLSNENIYVYVDGEMAMNEDDETWLYSQPKWITDFDNPYLFAEINLDKKEVRFFWNNKNN